jgi:formylglycine-generating enzyme required for sulfatase activity
MNLLNVRKFKCYTSFVVFLLLQVVVYASELPGTIKGNDGVDMVLIPGGKFIMGSEEEDLKKISPQHTVHVDAFYMDR